MVRLSLMALHTQGGYRMPVTKPFHRIYRPVDEARTNAGYSSWAYIIDRDYATAPEHYVRALQLIQSDLRLIFEYLEPSSLCQSAYSYRTHALLMRTCIEIEANFKAILDENVFTPPAPGRVTISHYRKVDASHHLSSYKVMLPIWEHAPLVLEPFAGWAPFRGQTLPTGMSPSPHWYQAYNASKHDRQSEFRQANLKNLLDAVAALLILVSSQFRGEEFGAESRAMSISGYDYHSMEPATGGLFRIAYPDDWSPEEQYDFDWAILKTVASVNVV